MGANPAISHDLGKPTAPPWVRVFFASIVLIISSILLFARLGHYALWDDEAITALTSKSVWQTGDTGATFGHNILAYRNGLLLRNVKDRATPPLQFFLAAPFLGLIGDTSLAARLPFAICGLGCVALILWWLHKDGASAVTWVVFGVAIATNVSMFLFARQARYYGLAMLLSAAVAYSYLHLSTRRGVALHAILSTLLLAANYMTYAAVMLMMLVDYAVWGRRRRAIRGVDWLILLGPQIVIGALLVCIWNPLRINEPPAPERHIPWLNWHATLLWWNLRDLNACEFGVGALLIAAPFVALFTRATWLARALVALAIGIVFISIVTPQNPSDTRAADIRYLSFLIPLCITVGALTILPLARLSRPLAIALAVFAFGWNLLNFSFATDQPMRSTPYAYVKELIRPVPEPYTPVIQWIRDNVRPGESVLVAPPHMMYPLMFHAPQAIYAWQLSEPPPKELAHLPPIHIALRAAPDYIVAFGPHRKMLVGLHMKTSEPADYDVAARIDVPWKDVYRPELFWRAFAPLKKFNADLDGIIILRRERPQSQFRL